MLETLAIHAPDFDPTLTWLGTETPISLRALRGHVVVLDFFTSCCVNCMHVAPILHRLEERFAGEPLVVLGVHTGKFDHEQDSAVVRAAMDRMGIRHPVLVDEAMRTWHAFGVRSWPTLVLVRPEGTLAAVAPGEPDEAALTALVRGELDRARARGLLAQEPFAFLGAASSGEAGLRFPSKVAASPRGLLAVSDTGHGRVLVWNGEGELVAEAGFEASARGGIDADFEEPQGLAFHGEHELFVCDARKHTVVCVDLAARHARVIAGTGAMGLAPVGFEETPALATALRSPWDLAVTDRAVFVALSGSHQIAVVDRTAGTLRALAGTGAESRVDGPGRTATFSQPNGLVLVGELLQVADSESSSLRTVHAASGETSTLVYGSLFDWGHADGPFREAKLQHPMGLAHDGRGTLAVCDTYNGMVKLASLETQEIRTVARGFAEVSGAAFAGPGGALVVADTNRHRLVRLREDGAEETLTLALPAPPPPRRTKPGALEGAVGAVRFFDEVLVTEPAAGPGEVRLTVTLHAGEHHHFAEGAPYTLSVEVSRRSDLVVPAFLERRGTLEGETLTLALPLAVEVPAGEAIRSELVLHVRAMACREGEGDEAAVCEPFTGWWRVPLLLEAGGAHAVVARAAG